MRLIGSRRLGTVDECEMTERLPEVAELLVGVWVKFFCVEVDVVCELDHRVDCLARLVEPAGAGERLDNPKGAGEECALDPLLAAVAVEQWRTGVELGANGVDRAGDLCAFRVEQIRAHDAQRRGVEFVCTLVHEQRAPRLRPALFEDEPAHLIGFATPRLGTLRG